MPLEDIANLVGHKGTMTTETHQAGFTGPADRVRLLAGMGAGALVGWEAVWLFAPSRAW